MPYAIVSYEDFSDEELIVRALYPDYESCLNDIGSLHTGNFNLYGRHHNMRGVNIDTKVGDIIHVPEPDLGFGIKMEPILKGGQEEYVMKISIQHYKKQVPLEFIIESNYGIPRFTFNDGSVLRVYNVNKRKKYTFDLLINKPSHFECNNREWKPDGRVY